MLRIRDQSYVLIEIDVYTTYMSVSEGNERRLNGSVLAPIEDKAYQFFGATVKSNKKHDKLIVGSQ